MAAPTTPEPSLASLVARIARALAQPALSTGELAALRRMVPGQPPPLAWYRFSIAHLPDGYERQEQDWIAVTACLAILGPDGFRPSQPLGRVLAEKGYSEHRLERLLAAGGATLRLLLLRAARFVAAKGASCDWTAAAQLTLVRDSAVREAVRRRFASDFYRALGQTAR